MTGLNSCKSLEERIKEKGLLSKKELVDIGLHFYNRVAGIYFYKDKKGKLYFFTKKISKVGEPLYKLHFSRSKDYGKDKNS